MRTNKISTINTTSVTSATSTMQTSTMPTINTAHTLHTVHTAHILHTVRTAKLFTNGGSQAVRLPKDCRFDNFSSDASDAGASDGSNSRDREVFVHKIGDVVMLFPKEEKWASMLASLELFTDDFLAVDGAEAEADPVPQLPLEEREALL